MPRPVFSIVIPARNGRSQLETTFDSIAALDFDLSQIEVLVVDDGSTDGTAEFLASCDVPFTLRSERIDMGNQSAGTNRAIRMARGEFILGSAQDIIFHPDLLSRHLQWHRKHDDEDLVVLGYLPYPEDLKLTPFMFYLVNGGFQFAYFMIQDKMHVPGSFLYAPNFSVKAETLHQVGLFDESFPYGCQDGDLGIRLAMNGVRFVYEPQAIGYHDHPMELEGYKERQARVGRARFQLLLKHPDYLPKIPLWDMVLTRYLAYGSHEKDRDQILVRQLEARLLEQGDRYQELWKQAFGTGVSLDQFQESDQELIQSTQCLFECYERLLTEPWAKGFLEEAIDVDGLEKMRSRILLQDATNQTTIQFRGIMEKRLRSHGIDLKLVRSSEILATLVVHDCPDYGTALNFLDNLKKENNAPFNNEILFCDTGHVFSSLQKKHLSEVVTFVKKGVGGSDVLEAIREARGEMVIVVSGRALPRIDLIKNIADRLLRQVGAVGLVGGAVQDTETGEWKSGYSANGQAIVASPDRPMASAEVDVAIPELCIFTRTSALEILEREVPAGAGECWNEFLSREIRRRGRKVFHVPELSVQLPWKSVEPCRRKLKAG